MNAADMSVNSSSTSNNHLIYRCSKSKATEFLFISVATMKAIFILFLSTFIFHMGYQRWRQQRSFNTANHSDLFTYHLAAMELFWVVGTVCYLCCLYIDSLTLINVGLVCFSLTFYAELFFHLLTCVERYLAVVHPITYRGLRNTRGVRIRNICIGFVWLLSFGLQVTYVDSSENTVSILMFFFLASCLLVISFCSVSVLCVLIRPGPGEGGGDIERVDQSKRRAFYTIAAISAALWLWFISFLVVLALGKSSLLSESVSCVLATSIGWFNLPSCLVSPLLFLHRAGKLSCSCFKCG